MKGLALSPLSASLPFLSFTPVFIVVTGYLILGERITPLGFMGILLILSGAYLIYAPEVKRGLLYPFKKIWKEKGSFYLLITAFIYGITSVLGKKGILLSDPVFFASFYFSLLSLLTPLVLKIGFRIRIFDLPLRKTKAFLLVGGTQALMCLFHMLALSRIETAYMIALKRTSIIFSVLLGWLVFRERYIKFRFIAAILMFLGILIIAFKKSLN